MTFYSTNMIIVGITVTVACLYIAWGIYDVHRMHKKKAEDYKKFVESLKPDSVWVEKEFYRLLNPFEASDLETVTVIETRYNHYDELWVRYKVNSETGIRAIKEDRASDFYKVYELTIV